jgi:fatty acid desaturase
MNSNEKLRAFRKQLAGEGFFERAPRRIIAELTIFVAATGVGVILLLSIDSLVVDTLAMWLITMAGMGMSTNAHTASHNAVSTSRWVNEVMTYFGYAFFLQVSVSYWRHKHLVVHHQEPNVAGHDDDVDLAPYFALTEQDVAKAGPVLRALYRVQWLYFPVLLAGNAFNVILTGWIFLIRKLLDPQERQLSHWLDLSLLLLHYVFWIILPMFFLPVASVVTFTLVRFTLMSYGMFALFAPAHFPSEAVILEPGVADDDWLPAQTVTAVNFRTRWLGRLICGGVEYQIEHHLFPTISPTHYPVLSPKVRDFCESLGYPHRTLGWGEGIWKSYTALMRPKPVFSRLDRAVIEAGLPEVKTAEGPVAQRVP